MPALGGHAKTRVEKSLDPAGKSACATGPPAVYDPVVSKKYPDKPPSFNEAASALAEMIFPAIIPSGPYQLQ
jgi:hypothetical protein